MIPGIEATDDRREGRVEYELLGSATATAEGEVQIEETDNVAYVRVGADEGGLLIPWGRIIRITYGDLK